MTLNEQKHTGINYYTESCCEKCKGIFKLDTQNTSYLIGIIDEERYIGHMYYGAKVTDYDLTQLLRVEEAPFVPSVNQRDQLSFLDVFPMEYSTGGNGDFRESCLEIQSENGSSVASLQYFSHKIYSGKPKLVGLPATFGDEESCATLELYCTDPILKVDVILRYSIFYEEDIIARSVRVINQSSGKLSIQKIMSACLDMDNNSYEIVTLNGTWGRERRIEARALGHGFTGISSIRGESSHQEHPFLALKGKNADYDAGEVYAMNFVYSGNFIAEVGLSQFDHIRAIMGIHPKNFCFVLEQGEFFEAPEVILTYSNQGLGQMSRNFHDLYRNHLIRGKYKDINRPILINNWEATYFDFNTDKLLSIAREAKKLGIEMLVMDDGWFGNRYDDNRALGDWNVNTDKLQGGLKVLVDEVNKLGMKFGIWFEPEMISKDSNLYREHPDWAIGVPGRIAGLCRNQYVLDITRQEVFDYVYQSVSDILHSANIEYVKWDMNRPLADLYSYGLASEKQGELSHRYMLAVYALQEKLIQEFPDLLLENCSSGGARFDPGMLYYSPQIWCSDDTDAIERLSIQEGTALIYPLSTIGAHVSDCPNHGVGRVTPFETRGYVALAGTFGYELDVTKISEEDRKQIPNQVRLYYKYNELVRKGDYYRIASYQENHEYDCYSVVSKDKTEALVTYIQVLSRMNYKSRRIKLKGLDPMKLYQLEEDQHIFSGDALMKAGICIQNMWGDFKGKLLHFIEVK